MNISFLSDGRLSPPTRWSVCAGGYMFLSATLTAVLLSDLLSVLAEVIGLPAAYALVIIASPTLLIGPFAWWGLVERRSADTYLGGAVFGLFTALLTGLFWTGQFVNVWGTEMLTADLVPVLVSLVLGATSIAGALAGLPIMYVRRRLTSRLSGS